MPSDAPSATPVRTKRGLRIVAGVAALALVAVVATGIVSRNVSAKRVRQWTDEQATPTVAVVSPSNDANPVVLELPGRLEAVSRAPIYARVSGYLKVWKADIGTRVKAGD